jgi:TM2 domain-containing membrane protein YozV
LLVQNRIKDPSAIEARLLELAHTTDTKLTATALAYYAPCSIEDAARVLDDLTVRDRMSMDVEDDGTIVYQLYGRQKIAPPPAQHSAPPLRPEVVRTYPTALAPIQHRYRTASPLLAALLSFMIPGAGHLYTGRVLSAFLWFMVVGMGYVLILPGLVLHLFSMVSAASSARQLNAGRSQLLLAPARSL